MSSTGDCCTYDCDTPHLPHVSFCYEHIPRYTIPPYDEIECPDCGAVGGHGTIHDDMYYCNECDGVFDPRDTRYLDKQR